MGGKVRSVKDYVKSCIRDDDPDNIILHVGMNDLNLENSYERIAKSIADFAKRLISKKRKVTF